MTEANRLPDAPDPRLDELEVNDVVKSRGMAGVTPAEIRITERSKMANPDQVYLAWESTHYPGWNGRGPQISAVRVERVHRAADAPSRPPAGVEVEFAVEVYRDGPSPQLPVYSQTDNEPHAIQLRDMYRRQAYRAHIVWRPVPAWRRLAEIDPARSLPTALEGTP
jgi:hypothetical protein